MGRSVAPWRTLPEAIRGSGNGLANSSIQPDRYNCRQLKCGKHFQVLLFVLISLYFCGWDLSIYFGDYCYCYFLKLISVSRDDFQVEWESDGTGPRGRSINRYLGPPTSPLQPPDPPTPHISPMGRFCCWLIRWFRSVSAPFLLRFCSVSAPFLPRFCPMKIEKKKLLKLEKN